MHRWLCSTLLLCFMALSAGLSLAIDKEAEFPPSASPSTGDGCLLGKTKLCVELDEKFTVVTFDGEGGNGPADPQDPCQRNDDDVTLSVPLPFTFDLYGTGYTSVYINNNGNISFGGPYSTYTPEGFPVAGFPMVAPFWSDVDTRGDDSGVVYYKVEATHMIVVWDHVGYFNRHDDKRNTFQLIISNGDDPLTGKGNVCFCYDDMEWTTGDASGGVDGFGGAPATAGINKGDGVSFALLGRFDHEGTDYDGPLGSNDGVSYLDGESFCFDASGEKPTPTESTTWGAIKNRMGGSREP